MSGEMLFQETFYPVSYLRCGNSTKPPPKYVILVFPILFINTMPLTHCLGRPQMSSEFGLSESKVSKV